MHKNTPQSQFYIFYLHVACNVFTVSLFHPLQAIGLDELVSTTSQAYAQYAQIVMNLKYADQDIEGDVVDPQVVAARRSEIEEGYIQELGRKGGRLFYRGDDFWYYRAIKNPQSLNCMTLDPVHGPRYCKLGYFSSLDDLKLKNPFLYLISFNQVQNICGFAAMVNAAAVEKQLKKGQVITFSETRRLAEEYLEDPAINLVELMPQASGGQIVDAAQDRLVRAATRLKLNDRTLEFLDKETVVRLHDRLMKGEIVNRNNDIGKKLLNGETLHIIYNNGGDHWVLLSVIKVADGIKMILLNSTNNELSEGNDCVLLLKYIDDLYVRLQIEKALNSPDTESMMKLEGRYNKDRLYELIKKMCYTADKHTQDMFYAKFGAASEQILGKRSSVASKIPLPQQPEALKKKSDTSLLIGLCGVVAVGVLIWLKKKLSTPESRRNHTKQHYSPLVQLVNSI